MFVLTSSPDKTKSSLSPDIHTKKKKKGASASKDGGSKHIAAHTFTFRELAVAKRNFRADCLLGEGDFGRAYKGRLESTNKIVAIKQLDPNGLQGNREFLVEKRLDWNTRMKIAVGAAKGLEYLHDKANPPVICRDLKCSTILLGEDYHPKLSDFGLAKLGPIRLMYPPVMGTYGFGYCAPEYAMSGQLTLKSEAYSFGVVLLEIITGRKAIDNTRAAGDHNLVAWIVAIKQLDRNGLQGNREFLVEVLMLSLLHHPNFVNLIAYCADGDQRLLKRLDWNTRMKIAAGAAKGLEYLHDKANPPVICRDLKCSTILLGEDYHPKLSDFGLAKLGSNKTHVSTRVMGTYGFGYCAPEYAMSDKTKSSLAPDVKKEAYKDGNILLHTHLHCPSNNLIEMGSREQRIPCSSIDVEPTAPSHLNTRMKIAAAAAKGLEYLHDKANPPVIYRDLKCSNILLGEDYHPKLSDFGLAKLGPVGDKTHVSTRALPLSKDRWKFSQMADPRLHGQYP
ncbi:hypothetical protein Tsubulata_026001, partial [Turnera subulata]